MEYEPKQKNKAPDMTVLALFLCGAVCMVFGSIEGVFGRGFLQLISLVFFCAMIFVLVKYKFTRIRYTVRLKAPKGYGDEDGEEDVAADAAKPVTAYPPSRLELYIESAQGKRTFIGENLVDLDKIVFFKKIPDVKSEKKALSAIYTKLRGFRYLKNMAGAEKWLLVAETDMGNIKIILEPGEKMAAYLSAVATYNTQK